MGPGTTTQRGLTGGLAPEVFRAKVLTARVTTESAQAAGRIADTFSNWLLGGLGAGLVFLVANLDKVTPMIPGDNFRRALHLYVCAAVLALLEKVLAVVANGIAKGHALFADLLIDADPQSVDPEVYFEKLREGTLWPMRGLVNKGIAAMNKGDVTCLPRRALQIFQVQMVLAFIEAALIVAAAAVIFLSL